MLTERGGYKKVQLGPKEFNIPKKWGKEVLGEIASIKNGYSFSSKDYSQNGALIVRIGNVGDGVFQHKRDKFLPMKFLEKYSSYKLGEGDLVIALTGDIGKYCFIPEEHAPALLNQRVGKVERNGNRSTIKFLYYAIGSKYFKDLISSFFVGSAQNNISSRELESASIILPPLSEQKKIAKILSTVDEAIQKTEEIIERSKKLKKGLMQDLLTKGIGHEEFKEVQLGPRKLKIPTEWKTSNLKDVAEIINGSTPSKRKEEFWSGDIVFITPTDITENGSKYISNSKEKITEEGLNSCSTHLLEPGAVLMTSRATIGEASINKIPVCTNQGFKNLVTGEKLYNEYLYYYIPLIKDYLNDIGGGSTFPEINKKDTETIRIPLPPLPEQKKIANILSKVDQKIQKEKDYKEKLEELKKGLMQDLLTGKVRVLPLLSEEEKEELKEADVPG